MQKRKTQVKAFSGPDGSLHFKNGLISILKNKIYSPINEIKVHRNFWREVMLQPYQTKWIWQKNSPFWKQNIRQLESLDFWEFTYFEYKIFFSHHLKVSIQTFNYLLSTAWLLSKEERVLKDSQWVRVPEKVKKEVQKKRSSRVSNFGDSFPSKLIIGERRPLMNLFLENLSCLFFQKNFLRER